MKMINFKERLKLDRLPLDNKKILLVALGLILILYLDFVFIIKLQLNSIKKIGPKIAKLEKDLGALDKDLANMEDLKRRQGEIKQRATSKDKKIISQEQVPSLLEDIYSLANNNNLQIMQIKPSKELKGKEEKSSKEASRFNPLLITLDLVCDYHNFGKFINDLENAPQFIMIEEIRITQEPTNYLQQKVNLVLKTYVKK